MPLGEAYTATRWLAVAITDETGSRAESVGVTRADRLVLTTAAGAAGGEPAFTVGAAADVDGVAAAGSELPAPSACELAAGVVAAGPQPAMPTTASAVTTPAATFARIHGMKPLSPPP